ncbi:LemA family protein [Hyphococcus sp.]|uniref:LemA family protein n=1 Tax=Hyphococcus sp. TaxID=2038636 RepID=UPI00207F1D32|nr:MAG: membrane protein [Marinicaulis sp.]
MNGVAFLAGVLAVLAVALAAAYNLLVKRRQLVNNGWSDIDVQLKRRADLIPQLVTTVKGYAAHERQLFEEIAEKRSAAMAAGDDPAARGETESGLSRPVAKLIAVAEDYPELKASGNFLDLQNELAETEDKIEMARRFYNGAVRELNTLVESFPVNLLAGPFGFSSRGYFEIEPTTRAAPAIDLDYGA